MGMPRSAAAVGKDFPYELATMCYIEVRNDGTVSQGAGPEVYRRALAGESRLFAAWPGQWRTDLFEIDDLDQYARATGIIYDQARTGLAEHEHDIIWKADPPETTRSQYIYVRVQFKCGCTIKDRGVFADHMKKQRGWDVATSGGWGSGGLPDGGWQWSIRVRRSTLK